METTVFNPQKMRLETIRIQFTNTNTTWFRNSFEKRDIHSITDYQNALVITPCSYNYPVLIYDVSRASIGYSRNRAFKLLKACYKECR